MPAKRRTAKIKASATPLDAQHSALLEQQEKLRKKKEQLERLIEEAPKVAAAKDKLRREELLVRSVQTTRRARGSVLNDKRFDAAFAPTMAGGRSRRRRALRAEQRQARLVFFALLLGLVVVLFWLWSVWGK